MQLLENLDSVVLEKIGSVFTQVCEWGGFKIEQGMGWLFWTRNKGEVGDS